MNATELTRQSETQGQDDPLDLNVVRKNARAIADVVRDPKCHPSMFLKAARALVDREISASELAELLDVITAKRSQLNSPGAYFVASLKRMFAAAGRQW